MLPLNLQNSIDNLITNLVTQLATLQPAYRSARGRYWQGAPTHSTPPSDGTATAPNRNAKPTDQTETWQAFGITLPATMEASLTVSVYQSRAGQGYVIHADVISSGIHHRRSVNIGPDAWRTHSWLTFKITPMS